MALSLGPGSALREARTGGAVALAVLMLGAPLGLLWAALTPRAVLAATAEGGLRLVDVEDRAFAGTDVRFVALALVVGVVLGALAWTLGRRQAIGVLLGTVVGALLASAAAIQVGMVFDDRLGTFADRTRTAAEGVPLRLPNALLTSTDHPLSLWLVMPAAAALVFTGLSLARGEAVSSGSREPAPTPGSAPPATSAAGPPPA